ncbi:protein YhfH [Planomicrobium sp. YIM 101495]|nr:protein YhfH [Planomicrobium sp. YIM 101495]MTD30528.1 YhfH family protein [Planomicrobium sp. YIM 101495]
MKTTTNTIKRHKKECCECGAEIKEQRESIIYECERCMTQKAE